jgi:hypothetical protein
MTKTQVVFINTQIESLKLVCIMQEITTHDPVSDQESIVVHTHQGFLALN